MTRNGWWCVILSMVVGFVVALGFLLKLDLERKAWEQVETVFPDRGVPRINIDLNRVSLEEINDGSKDTKYEGNELTLYDGREELREFEGVQVKGRGNTTWYKKKKPYQIKLAHNDNLLGMGKAKKWVLLANDLDVTHLRNDIAMMLAERVGMEYNHRGKYVELYVDSEYVGLYYLVQKVEIAKGSVDLRREDGLLFELDMVHRGNVKYYKTYLNEYLVLKDSVMSLDEKEEDGLIEGFIRDLNEIEMAIEAKNYEKLNGMMDVDAFAKYFLVNEFTVNPDAYSTSFYLYRNNDGKIAAGPVWDFDLAFSNREWIWNVDDRMFSPEEEMVKKREAFGYDGLEEDVNISKLFYYLMDIPEFRGKVVELFRETLMGQKERIIGEIIDKESELENVIMINNQKWKSRREFEKEYDYLMKWLEARFDYFEKTYGDGFIKIES